MEHIFSLDFVVLQNHDRDLWPELSDAAEVHSREPRRTSIFVTGQIAGENRVVMTCSVIINSKYRSLAWMLRPIALSKNPKNSLVKSFLQAAFLQIQ
jgi:hypothetical protein